MRMNLLRYERYKHIYRVLSLQPSRIVHIIITSFFRLSQITLIYIVEDGNDENIFYKEEENHTYYTPSSGEPLNKYDDLLSPPAAFLSSITLSPDIKLGMFDFTLSFRIRET
mmetsp:Transcript_15674/g.18580  ORF Transcript_15674/g.18580 Transcript_15674/m.18580 type:complete len:112 (+) Transcript_15674:204-539(+)